MTRPIVHMENIWKILTSIGPWRHRHSRCCGDKNKKPEKTHCSVTWTLFPHPQRISSSRTTGRQCFEMTCWVFGNSLHELKTLCQVYSQRHVTHVSSIDKLHHLWTSRIHNPYHRGDNKKGFQNVHSSVENHCFFPFLKTLTIHHLWYIHLYTSSCFFTVNEGIFFTIHGCYGQVSKVLHTCCCLDLS